MADAGISFVLGVILSGLGLSACWGMFWSTMAGVGVARGTSGWKVMQASLTAGLVPLILVLALLWAMDLARAATWPFLMGLATLPLLVIGLALRKLPDGSRVGERLIGGSQTMMDTILGKHSGCGGCGGCGDDHSHEH